MRATVSVGNGKEELLSPQLCGVLVIRNIYYCPAAIQEHIPAVHLLYCGSSMVLSRLEIPCLEWLTASDCDKLTDLLANCWQDSDRLSFVMTGCQLVSLSSLSVCQSNSLSVCLSVSLTGCQSVSLPAIHCPLGNF